VPPRRPELLSRRHLLTGRQPGERAQQPREVGVRRGEVVSHRIQDMTITFAETQPSLPEIASVRKVRDSHEDTSTHTPRRGNG